MNVRRLRAVVRFALGEVLHLRVLWSAAIVACGVAAMCEIIATFHFGHDRPQMILGLARGSIEFGGTLIAVMLPVMLLSEAFRGSSALLWLVRGVSRAEWLAGQFLAVAIALVWFVVIGGAGLIGTLSLQGYDVDVALVSRLLAHLAVELWVVAGAGFLVAAVARGSTLPIFVGLGFAGALELLPAIDAARVAGGGSAGFATSLLIAALPNFERQGAVVLCVHALAYFAFATAIFERREL